MPISPDDRQTLIRLAAALPAGSEDRRTLLASLRSSSSWSTRGLVDMAKNCTFHFRNQASADLWTEQLIGQISDGMWENSSNTGWPFWDAIPTVVDGKTHLEGVVPGDIKRNFNFTNSMLLDAVGEDMLLTVRKTQPNATSRDVVRFLQEIKLAVGKGIASENAPLAGKPAAPAPSPSSSPASLTLNNQRSQRLIMLGACALAAEILTGVPDASDITAESFMYAPAGGRANQYHYFVYLSNGAVCSAYGKYGKGVPKGILLGKTFNLAEAKKMITSKAKAKASSGYEPTLLEGIRHYMDPLSGMIHTP